MPPITTDPLREIITDFVSEIKDKQILDQKPAKTIIRFRTDVQDKKEREIVKVPINILRYRKDNGRIASDVLDYEINTGPLDEQDEKTQKILHKFLLEKDPKKTHALLKSIIYAGQSEPATITCDGFLINGNRRRMVLRKLSQDFPAKEDYKFMSVVILPGKGDEGGPPTLKEIAKLENRYQMQDDGKSEYSGFDRALTIKKNIQQGFSLEAQLRDDSRYASFNSKEMKKQITQIKKDYLRPLECAERYLKQFHKEGQYRLISTGTHNKEGRWQALIDYSNIYHSTFKNPSKRLKHNINEDDIGDLEVAAFNIIRLRTFPKSSLPKVHQIMRKIPKYCEHKEGKKQLLRIAKKVTPILPDTECLDGNGAPLTPGAIEDKWKTTYLNEITYKLVKVVGNHNIKKAKETPVQLLEAAYKKVTHDDLDITAIVIGDFKKARKLATKIADRAGDLEKELYEQEKKLKKLHRKKL